MQARTYSFVELYMIWELAMCPVSGCLHMRLLYSFSFAYIRYSASTKKQKCKTSFENRINKYT